MANYFSAGIDDVPFLADEDLTSWQWRLVMAASTAGYVQKYDILPTAASPRLPLGVLTNDPSAGQEASVKVIGFTKAVGQVSTCYLSHGALLSCSNNGNYVAASQDKSDHVAGIWFGPSVTSGSAYGNVLVNPFPASGAQLLSSVN
jgi:hypothetical protein